MRTTLDLNTLLCICCTTPNYKCRISAMIELDKSIHYLQQDPMNTHNHAINTRREGNYGKPAPFPHTLIMPLMIDQTEDPDGPKSDMLGQFIIHSLVGGLSGVCDGCGGWINAVNTNIAAGSRGIRDGVGRVWFCLDGYLEAIPAMVGVVEVVIWPVKMGRRKERWVQKPKTSISAPTVFRITILGGETRGDISMSRALVLGTLPTETDVV